MKTILIILGLALCFVGGVMSHRLYVGACTYDKLQTYMEHHQEWMEKFAPSDEGKKVAALRATIDTLGEVRLLDAEGADDETRRDRYRDELVVRMEDIRQTLNNTGEYQNEYSVGNAFERANGMLRDLGYDKQLAPYD